jgi:hypothetical protein
MPSKLTMTSHFQLLDKQPVIDEETDIPADNAVTSDTGILDAVLSIGKCKQMLNASNVESFIAQLGKNQEGHTTLLIGRACLELCILLQENKSDTCRRTNQIPLPNQFLAPKGAGECCIKTGEGKQEDQYSI